MATDLKTEAKLSRNANVRMSETQMERWRDTARILGVPFGEFIRRAVDAYCERLNSPLRESDTDPKDYA